MAAGGRGARNGEASLPPTPKPLANKPEVSSPISTLSRWRVRAVLDTRAFRQSRGRSCY